MDDIYCYSYAEDAPSAEVARRLVAERNTVAARKILFLPGFPALTGGCSALQEKCSAFLNMAKAGIYTFSLTDLDTRPCAGALIREWFAIPAAQLVSLPRQVIFRVAVREVESWIIADREAWATYIGIAAKHFSGAPDTLPDPKQHLLNIVRKKGHRRYRKKMLPVGTASIGPGYNEVLCDFARKHWSPHRAAERSPSLLRAINALRAV
jgi:hypothetical protein